MTTMEELMSAALHADDERKTAALRALRGKDTEAPASRPGPERFLSLTELGRQLGISPCTLWRWRVPGHELAGRRRFRVSEVEAYLKSDEFRRRVETLQEARKERKALEASGAPRRPRGRPRKTDSPVTTTGV